LETNKSGYEKDKLLMKTLNKTILAVLATGLISCALFSQQAQAVPMVQINGTITFAGGVELDTGTVNTATMVTGWLDQNGQLPTVQSRAGDFATFVNVGDTAAFHAPWSFVSGPITSFWSVGGFTFDLIASHITSQGGGFLDVSGTGTISGHGFTPTFGTWSFSTQDPASSAVFSFSASTGSVPDSGSTVAFLGLSLAGVEALRRKMSRS
jgi:VPDSG-CTERM motif